MNARFAAVVLDVDSTISGIEGIDWLGERRGPAVAARIATLTDEAMRGVIPLEAVYGSRLEQIRPSRADIDALSQSYIAALAPGCREAVRRMLDAGVRVVMVSGGLKQAIEPLAELLGVATSDLNAVDIRFGPDGAYTGFDQASLLTTANGKQAVLEQLGLPRPILAVGDGATDVAMRQVADTFAAFVGFARRENVVAHANVVVDSFFDLARLVFET